METVKLAGFGRNGAVLDVAEYDAPPESFNEVRNFRFNSIGAVSFSGHRSVLAPAPINPLWLRVFPPVDFPRWVYADQQKVYIFDDGHLDISRPGGYNGVVNERWQGEVFSGVGIFNNTVDVPQMWPAFSSAVPLADLSNWPANLRCKFLRPFKVFLMAGFLTENGNDHPFRIRWSHPADPGTVPPYWDVGNPAHDSGELELSETDDYVVDGRTLGESFIVYKQKTTHLMYLTGNSRVFGQRTIVSGKGALTRDCVQDIPGGHFVAGIDDIYVHTGQKGSEVSLVEAKVKNWIYNQIDASNFFNCYTVDYRAAKEIWFCFPEAGEIYPTIAMIWNTVTGGIGFRDIQNVPFMWSGPVDERTTDGDIWGGEEQDVLGMGALVAPLPLIEGTGPGFALQSADVNGTDFTSSAAWAFGTSNFTCEFWFNAGETGIDGEQYRVLRARPVGGSQSGWEAQVRFASSTTRTIRLLLRPTTTSFTYTSSAVTVSASEWHHYALVVDRVAQTVTFYLDAVQVGSPVSIATAGAGAVGFSGSNSILNSIEGAVDELRVWNTARSAAEILANYLLAFTDYSDATLIADWQFDEGAGADTEESKEGLIATLAPSASFVVGPI